jgi:glycosyltransferase involved in cell wall biosynthesis
MSGFGAARTFWRCLAPESLRHKAQPAVGRLIRGYVAARLRRGPPQRTEGPIRVVGLFAGTHGIAGAARLTAEALEALGAPVERISVTQGFDRSVRLSAPTSAAAWIFHLNPPELPLALASLGPSRIVGPRYGAWAWELPAPPPGWLGEAAFLDEVWAPSRYTARAFAGAAAPVRATPHPLVLSTYDAIRPAPRTHDFQAVALFDFNSSAARKNPEGAISAFARAFGDDPTVRLTLKTQNGASYPDLLAALRAKAPANVEIIDAVWPYAQVLALIAGADVLLSPHRAEGFGLTLAEAMALGTPVAATGFSGNVDFMDETCGLMIPATLTPVDDPQGVYQEGQAWAEPDLDVAASALARLRLDPALGRRLAAAARRRVEDQLAPQPWLLTLPPAVQAAVAARQGR